MQTVVFLHRTFLRKHLYFSPKWGRFLNADIYLNANGDIIGYNLFAYCGNDPVLCCDYSGEGLVSIFAALALLAAAALIPSSSCLSAESSKNKTGAESSTKILYDVPLYNQGNLSLCWAYCEVMVDSYNNSEILNKRIAREKAIQIAQKYHNSTSKEKWNKGGWPSNLGDRVEINSINELYDVLSNNGPVYGLYNCDSSTHLIVITGVYVDNNLVYTNNPWGIEGKQSFEAFQKGIAKRWWQSDDGLVFDAIYLIN